jgi:hypothetical protein
MINVENNCLCDYCGVKINKINFGGMFFRGIVLHFLCNDFVCRQKFLDIVKERENKLKETKTKIMARFIKKHKNLC